MKILINSTTVLPSPPWAEGRKGYGGLELITWLLARGLAELGHQVWLACPQGSIPPDPKVQLIPNVYAGQEFVGQYSAQNLEPHIKELKPDIVNDHDHYKPLYKLCRDLKINYVPTSHNPGIPQFEERQVCLTTLSQSHAKIILEKFGIESKYVYNGLDPSYFKFIRPKLRSERFLVVARPSPEKGLLQVIEFCLKRNIPLDVIAGRIPFDNTTYLLAVARACRYGSTVMYHGEKSIEEKNAAIANSKAQIFLPQFPESFGLNIIESLLSGVPTITNDVGAMKEIVREGQDGFVIPVDRDEQGRILYIPYSEGWYSTTYDQKKLEEAISKVDTLNYSEINANAKIQWSYQRMANDYAKIYEQVLDGQRW